MGLFETFRNLGTFTTAFFPKFDFMLLQLKERINYYFSTPAMAGAQDS